MKKKCEEKKRKKEKSAKVSPLDLDENGYFKGGCQKSTFFASWVPRIFIGLQGLSMISFFRQLGHNLSSCFSRRVVCVCHWPCTDVHTSLRSLAQTSLFLLSVRTRPMQIVCKMFYVS